MAQPPREGDKWMGNVAKGNARVHYGHNYNTTNINGVSKDEQRRQQLLDSLNFDQIDWRRGHIDPPANDTLEWAFHRTEPPPLQRDKYDDYLIATHGDVNFDRPHWSNLATWLRDDSSMYWVCGKAGSGKSTLMAHIVDNPRAIGYLEQWAQDKEIHVLSFFFWRAGTGLQNNIRGLLQSLLREICTKSPTGMSAALEIVHHPLPPWTVKRLTTVIINALKSSEEYFCMFIDGIDEYLGDLPDLVDLLEQLQSLDDVKACVSSRPEPYLMDRLSDLKQLRLDSLNSRDIHRLAQQKLAPSKSDLTGRLAYEVAKRADGVFLWAVLVLQSLVRGLASRDDLEMLLRRLDSMPENLETLFSRLLLEVDEVHREPLEFYLQLMTLKRQCENNRSDAEAITSVCHIVAAQSNSGIASYKSFEEACRAAKTQIPARSAGLLEVKIRARQIENQSRRESSWPRSSFKFGLPSLCAGRGVVWKADVSHLKRTVDDRAAMNSLQEYPPVVSFEHYHLDWIHRSAFDFVQSRDLKSELKVDGGVSKALERTRIGMLRYLVIAPSCSGPAHDSLTQNRLGHMICAALGLYAHHKETISAFMDELHELAIGMNSNEFDWEEELNLYRQAQHNAIGEVVHLHCMSDVGSSPTVHLHDFAMEKFDLWSTKIAENFVIDPLYSGWLWMRTEDLLHLSEPGDFANYMDRALRALLEKIRGWLGGQCNQRTFIRTFHDSGIDPMQSFSCRWPVTQVLPETSSGNASAMWAVVHLCLKILYPSVDPHERSVDEERKNVEHFIPIAEDIFRILDVYSDITAHPGAYWLHHWTPHRLTIEISWKQMQRLIDRSEPPDPLHSSTGIRVLCFPKALPFSGLLHEDFSLPSRRLWRRGPPRSLDSQDGRSYNYFPQSFISHAHSLSSQKVPKDVVKAAFESDEPPLQLNHDISTQHIEVSLSLRTMHSLFKFVATHMIDLPLGIPSPRQSKKHVVPALVKALECVVEDIMKNENEKLTATQQLFARACVKAEIAMIQNDVADYESTGSGSTGEEEERLRECSSGGEDWSEKGSDPEID